jgi:hypothetical protein
MVARKSLVGAILAVVCATGLAAQWREEAARIVSKNGDFRALSTMIESAYPDLPAMEKPDAAALLAYCAVKSGDPQAELRWVIEFFEAGRAADSGFVFLDFNGQTILAGYLNGWKAKYPWIRDVALIKGVGDEIIIPEGVLPLAVEMSSPVLYKFFEGEEVLKAGALQTGFNVIGLDANTLFRDSRRRVYFLEVKSGPLILKREITLDVTVSWPMAPKPKPQPAPTVGKLARLLGTPNPPPPPPAPKIREYHLDMYVGGDLLMSSQKNETIRPIVFGLKPSNNPTFLKPDWNIKRNDPWMNPNFNSFSILDAIGVVGGLLKDLFKKKSGGEAEPPRIQTVQELNLDFKFKDAEANPLEMRVEMKLGTTTRPVLRSGL